MRLTLRTLLAHEHGLLNEQQSAGISQKIEQSPFVIQLLRHLRDRTQRREIVPLALDTRGLAAIANVVRYLDHELPAADVVALENECFSSDRLLAEVAACHEILAQWLTTPTAVEPGLRHRLYELAAPKRAVESSATVQDLWTALPSTAAQPGQADSLIERPDPRLATTSRSGSSSRRVFSGIMVMAATIAVLVTAGIHYRDHVEEVLRQHWRNGVAQQTENPMRPAATRPESFVVGTPSPELLEKPAHRLPEDLVSEPPTPVVATTAFHIPLEPNGPRDAAISDATETAWETDEAWGAVVQPQAAAEWTLVRSGVSTFARTGEARLVVAQNGYCKLNHRGTRWTLVGPAELRWQSEKEMVLRYGQLLWSPGKSEPTSLTVAGQVIRIENPSAEVNLRLTTVAIALDGVDYSRDTANQEVWLECLEGATHLHLSSRQEPLLLEEGKTWVAHATAGVRSTERFVEAAASLTQSGQLTQIENQAVLSARPDDLLSGLRQLAETGREAESTWAGELLAQLDRWETVVAAWNTEVAPEEFGRHASRLRRLLAQNQESASRLESELLKANPDLGPLIYRLVCGFSEDQRSEVTLEQLRNLAEHPEPSVRQWARFQLTVDGLAVGS